MQDQVFSVRTVDKGWNASMMRVDHMGYTLLPRKFASSFYEKEVLKMMNTINDKYVNRIMVELY